MLRSSIQNLLLKQQKRYLHKNNIVEIANKKCGIEKIRNIGILAHIDAGKTTTTERMLYYSGLIKQMGEVHDGNTVTDFMDQERQRGITICSAAVTLNWKDYRFNLIDTPGHIDFTMGVEQTLGVLDGVVIVLDGSAGVEAQTTTVWTQANKYYLPRIIYVNKMDRQDADFEMSIQSVESKLDSVPIPIHFPLKDENELIGLIDIITLEKIIFDKKTQGRVLFKSELSVDENKVLFETVTEKRRCLIDKLSGLDDELADTVIENNSLDVVTSQAVVDALRRVTISQKGVPVLLGSSYKNIGVQSLMDGVVLYLPTPNYNHNRKLYKCFEDNFSARVFKIIHDKQRGPIAFFRIYTGNIRKGQKFYNVQRGQMEQSSRLYAAYADDYEEITEMGQGNIAAVTGLKYTVTGDLLTNNASIANKVKIKMENEASLTTQEIATLFSIGTNVPDPVFFCSIEPPSLSQIPPLEIALQELEKEDPSLRVTHDSETGQIILAGMGELHIDIIKERIRSEYKIDVDLGELQIAYKETIKKPIKDTHIVQCEIGSTKQEVKVTLSLIPDYEKNTKLLLDGSKESAANLVLIQPQVMKAVKKGIDSAFLSGPKLSCPVVDVGVKLHWIEVKRGTTESIITAAVSQCIKKMMEEAGSILLEPIMNLEVVVLDSVSSKVMADLSKKEAVINAVSIRGQYKIISCMVSLSELLGYATKLRIISSGNASFSMEFSHYQEMNSYNEQLAIKRVTGF